MFVAIACTNEGGGGGQGGAAVSSSTGLSSGGGGIGGDQAASSGGVAGMGPTVGPGGSSASGVGGSGGSGGAGSGSGGFGGAGSGSGGFGGAGSGSGGFGGAGSGSGGSGGAGSGSGGSGGAGSGSGGSGGAGGCNADLMNDPNNCGMCGAVCATGLCTAGLCHAAACNGVPGAQAGSAKGTVSCYSTSADCNADPLDGCETNLERDPNHCGMCGNACASGFCTAGACAPMPTVGGTNGCPAGTLDCDGNMANGCETDVANDPSHCGDCFYACPGNTPTSTATCALGRCGILCNAGQGDCDLLPDNGCEMSLNDAHACGGCGHHCDPAGCNAGACWHPAIPLATGTVHSIAVDATSIYWTDGASTVRKLPIQGGCETVLVSGANGAAGIAVDATSVYFASPAAGTINKVPLDGGTVTVLASGQQSAAEIAIDDANVFWAAATQSSISSVGKAGGTVQTIAPTQAPFALAVDDTDVYFTEAFIYVRRVPKTGGTPSILAQVNKPRYIALDATHLYLSDAGVNTVSWWPKGGGIVTTAIAPATPGKVTLDNDHVYWTSMGGGTWKAKKIDATRTSLLSFFATQGTGIAVDATGLYVAMGITLWKVAK